MIETIIFFEYYILASFHVFSYYPISPFIIYRFIYSSSIFFIIIIISAFFLIYNQNFNFRSLLTFSCLFFAVGFLILIHFYFFYYLLSWLALALGNRFIQRNFAICRILIEQTNHIYIQMERVNLSSMFSFLSHRNHKWR